MPVNRFWIPVIIISTLLGTVFGSQALGWWATSGRASVNLDELSPESIKGWMTLQNVADGLGLTIEEVYRAGNIPAHITPDTALKDMEDVIEVSELREALADYLENGEMFEPVPTPTPPANLTKGTPKAPDGEHFDGTGPTPLPPGEVLPADQIKGRMTLREVSVQCAVDLNALLAALGLPSDTDPDTQLKTLTQDGTLNDLTAAKDAVAILQQVN